CQGVTSEVVGNCGFSLFPELKRSDALVPTFEIFQPDHAEIWEDAGAYFDDLESTKSRTNVAALTGHGTLRARVKGAESGPLNAAQATEARNILESCVEQGSTGLSTGLNEVPSCFAGVDELVSLCRVVHKHGGLYTSHLRDYKFAFLQAVEEALEIGRRTGIPVQLSHLQAVGQKNWHRMDPVLELIEKAHRDGVDVGIDAYPYVAGSCQLTQNLPTWALEGGTAELVRRLENPEIRRRIAGETEAARSNTWADILIVNVVEPKTLIGRNVQEIADERGVDGIDAALDLLLANRGAVHIVSFNQSDENLRKVLSHPLTSIITDGLHHEGIPHPRTFGTYPTLFGEFVRGKGWLSLEEAVHKSTALPAERFKLRNRGRVEPGYQADLLIFSPKEIGTQASYLEPDLPPQGIRDVMVNGRWALRDGELCDQFAGSALRHRN
ncbi:MAG: N-acyl-D-amino-acid deacylase family protein, partial [Gammaproteobacteria bacterium]